MDDNSHIAPDPFAPLSPGGVGEDASTSAKPAEWLPIMPAPSDPPPKHRHAEHGIASSEWIYRGASGAALFAICRFDLLGGGKVVLPLCYGTLRGRTRWHWKAAPTPRPLYGLDRLAARPDAPVLLVEGEKTSDAAALLFPEMVTMTWPGGAAATKQADWTPLQDRDITIWPDADKPGRDAATTIATLLTAGRAAPARIVAIPAGWPEAWDLADDPPVDASDDTLRDMLAAARPMVRDAPVPAGFALRQDGVFAISTNNDPPPMRICGALSVEAVTDDGAGHNFGRLLEWRDLNGKRQEWAMPATMLAGDGTELRSRLLDRGLVIEPARKQREALMRYLGGAAPAARVRVVSRLGWHDTSDGRIFVLPGGAIGAQGDLRVMLQTDRPDAMPPLVTSGTLDAWARDVAAPCRGNSRAILSLSAAFAAPLLRLLDVEGGGMHWRGQSSTGKTTLLALAGSVWGGGGPNGWVRRWRATDNGLEAVAAGHNDLLLCLDEMGEASGETVAASAYQLANGGGKARASRDGGARKAAEWRLLFLSTGETSLAARLAETRGGPRRVMAGQEVRVLDMPADAGAGHGVFENLHGEVSGAGFQARVDRACRRNYGTAGREYLTRLTADLADLTAAAQETVCAFVADHVPQDADGQVQRAGERFALLAAAGEMATVLGIVPWADGEAKAAAVRCFGDWRAGRDGGDGPAEDATALAAVGHFIGANAARFEDGDAGIGVPPVNRAGYRKTVADELVFCIFAETWKRDVVPGLDPRAAAQALDRHGYLVRDGERLQKEHRVGASKTRFYTVRATIIGDHRADPL